MAVVTLHILMYAMGDKYSIESLRRQSTAYFIEDFRTPEQTVHKWDNDPPGESWSDHAFVGVFRADECRRRVATKSRCYQTRLQQHTVT